MGWLLKHKNILDEPADVLICSANVNLNLSGGVGAALLERYGLDQQAALHAKLASRSPHCARQGEVIAYESAAIPYKAILHVVAIDAWYHSTPAIIEETVAEALKCSATYGARRVALTALATGFGDVTLLQFAQGVSRVLCREFPPIDEVVVCLDDELRVRELHQHLPSVYLEV